MGWVGCVVLGGMGDKGTDEMGRMRGWVGRVFVGDQKDELGMVG
jgi:hypothetical protein